MLTEKPLNYPKKVTLQKNKNQKGYQLLVAFTGDHSETVSMFLDSGSSHCTDHYDDLLKAILIKFKEQLYNGKLILRTDSAFGSSANVEKLRSTPGLRFVTKGYSTVAAKNLAKDIDYSEYTKADQAAWVYELPENNTVRYIIVQTLSAKGKLKYSLLITNISAEDMSAAEVFHFYNKRQTIEALFKMAKNVYHIKKP